MTDRTPSVLNPSAGRLSIVVLLTEATEITLTSGYTALTIGHAFSNTPFGPPYVSSMRLCSGRSACVSATITFDPEV